MVIESTVSPGTIDKYVRPVVEAKGFVIGRDIHLAHAPERIIPGNMVYELKHNSPDDRRGQQGDRREDQKPVCFFL